jgi:hypothetical protein
VAINYIAEPLTWNRLLAINFDIREELRRLEGLHQQQTGFSEGIVAAWDEFIRDLLQETVNTAQNFVRGWVTTARNEYRDRNEQEVIMFLALLSTLLRHALDLELPYNQLP